VQKSCVKPEVVKRLADQYKESFPAIIYFYRPKKRASSDAKIIVGTERPDQVLVKLKNGSWCKVKYLYEGTCKFSAGLYAINPEPFVLEVNQGQNYYIKCQMLSKGLKLMAELEVVDRWAAEHHMNGLEEQVSPI